MMHKLYQTQPTDPHTMRHSPITSFLGCFCLLLLLCLLVFPGMAEEQGLSGPGEKKLQISLFVPELAIPSIYHVPMAATWLNDSYLTYTIATPDGFERLGVDPGQKKQEVLCNESGLAAIISPVHGSPLNRSDIMFSTLQQKDDMTLEVRAADALWLVDILHKTAVRVDRETQTDVISSPDEQYQVGNKDDNLWLFEKGRPRKVQLTRDGSPNRTYSSAYVRWSPDSLRFTAVGIDSENLTTLPLLEWSPGESILPRIKNVPTGLPGDQSIMYERPYIFEAKSGKRIAFGVPPQPVTRSDHPAFWGGEAGNKLFYITTTRGDKNVSLYSIDTLNGNARLLIEEDSPTYYEPNLDNNQPPNIRVLSDGRIIWFSERDGNARLYLYTSQGKLIRPLTDGTLIVRDILAVDEKDGSMFVTAGGRENGRDPYYRHLYRIGLLNRTTTLLTPEDADHDITLSPDRQYFMDTHSRTDLPPVSVIRRADGSLVMTLENADITGITRNGWRTPETFTAVAADNTTVLYGLIVKPTRFDQNSTYPVIEYVYPGPFCIVTPKAFPSSHDGEAGSFWLAQALADQGFIVVFLDARGTAFRDKRFHDASYGRMGDSGLPDHVAALRQIALNRTWMDLSRVGIYGHSGGGFMTAQAMLTYPDFYDVGVASAGNYDNRLYNYMFVERFLGYPVNKTTYEAQVTGLKAKNLAGHLLLTTGDVDDNVNPTMTMQFAKALVEERKMFDMLILPGKDHQFLYDQYYMGRLIGYFIQHLQGKDPVMVIIPAQDPTLLAEYGGSFNNHTFESGAPSYRE